MAAKDELLMKDKDVAKALKEICTTLEEMQDAIYELACVLEGEE